MVFLPVLGPLRIIGAEAAEEWPRHFGFHASDRMGELHGELAPLGWGRGLTSRRVRVFLLVVSSAPL